jgi:hypothetical protein
MLCRCLCSLMIEPPRGAPILLRLQKNVESFLEYPRNLRAKSGVERPHAKPIKTTKNIRVN